MAAGRRSAFPADVRHMFPVFGNALAAFSPDFSHMLLISRDGKPTLPCDFLTGRGVHRRSPSGSRAALCRPSARRLSFQGVIGERFRLLYSGLSLGRVDPHVRGEPRGLGSFARVILGAVLLVLLVFFSILIERLIRLFVVWKKI